MDIPEGSEDVSEFQSGFMMTLGAFRGFHEGFREAPRVAKRFIEFQEISGVSRPLGRLPPGN